MIDGRMGESTKLPVGSQKISCKTRLIHVISKADERLLQRLI
jgi:hypothetical protein